METGSLRVRSGGGDGVSAGMSLVLQAWNSFKRSLRSPRQLKPGKMACKETLRRTRGRQLKARLHLTDFGSYQSCRAFVAMVVDFPLPHVASPLPGCTVLFLIAKQYVLLIYKKKKL